MCNNLLLNFILVLAYYVCMHICSVGVLYTFYQEISQNTLLLLWGGKKSLPSTTRVEQFARGLVSYVLFLWPWAPGPFNGPPYHCYS